MKPDTLQELIAQCDSDDAEQQSHALIELVTARATQAVPAILPLLDATDQAVRVNAVYALGALGREHVGTVGPALVALLGDPDPLMRSEAMTALGMLAYRPAAQPIAELLQHDVDAQVRAEAAEVLGDLDDTDVLPGLHAALARDPDESVRTYAANSIGLLGEPPSHAVLQECLTNEASPHVQAEILGARYRLGDAAALPPLLALLHAADEGLGACVLELLKDLLTRRVPPAIASDAPALATALAAVSARVPALQQQVAQLRHYLPRA
jgi:HEAT repeat protein